MRIIGLALLIALAFAVPASARLRVEPVQAIALEQVQALYAAGQPWPGVNLDEAWLGRCFRHGSRFIKCRVWAAYSRVDEIGLRRVQLCHAFVAVRASDDDASASVGIPRDMACGEIPA